jgi:murein DD-endopeptidase MepM/ murein hydrolase activator NlpD
MIRLPYLLVSLALAGVLNHGASTVLAQSTPPPTATRSFAADGVTIDFFSEAVRQGRAGLVRVSGNGLTDVRAEVFLREFSFFQVPGDRAYYGFVAVSFDQAIRTYDMTLTVQLNGAPRAILVPLEVRSGEFLRQDVTLREDQLALINPEVEANEFLLLDNLTARVTDGWYGIGGFAPPADTDLTSPYGAVRVFNERFETRHTGWDYVGETGDLLRAMADGRVVFAGTLPIRGGYVLVDHGRGVYSGYAHLSVRRVAVGQFVRRGDVVGLAGSTGRSSSAHLHIEMRVNDIWVDPVAFIEMWTP